MVLKDIVVSNVEVARRILGPRGGDPPGFVWVPLTIPDPHGIVALAGIVTHDAGHAVGRAHAPTGATCWSTRFNVDDAAALIADIKARYEAPLLEIFEMILLATVLPWAIGGFALALLLNAWRLLRGPGAARPHPGARHAVHQRAGAAGAAGHAAWHRRCTSRPRC